jgi:pimeloyl-ACP methyl ester carboxylesterase
MPQLKISDFELHYEVYGNGEPVVLIPGFAGGAWMWSRQVASLARKFRVITFDPRGIGQSSFGFQALTIRLLADDLTALLRELRIDKAHILGASFGGFVGQEFALAYPDSTRTLSLCCTSFGGPNHVAPSMEILMTLASTSDFNDEDRIRRSLSMAFSADFVRDRADEIDELIKLRMANTVMEEAYRSQLMAAVAFNAESRVGAIKAPTLVLSGDADVIVPLQNSRNLAAKVPGAEFRSIAAGSHLFFIEQADEFNSVVMDFIERWS